MIQMGRWLFSKENKRPLVAVATILVNQNNQILVGRRKDNNLYNCPG